MSTYKDPDLKALREETADAVDLIDSALYTGDEFLNEAARNALRAILNRWSLQLHLLEQ